MDAVSSRRGEAVTEGVLSSKPCYVPCSRVVAHGTVEASGVAWELKVSQVIGNSDLRAIAQLLVAAADRIKADPTVLDTRIEV